MSAVQGIVGHDLDLLAGVTVMAAGDEGLGHVLCLYVPAISQMKCPSAHNQHMNGDVVF